MCGRYRLSRRKELIAGYFDMVDEIDWEPHYNIAPTKNVGIIRQGRTQPVRKFALVRWGLIPYWAKDPSIGQKMINARSETILDKPAFREAFQNRRCLVPANGFYEWKRTGRSKQPIHIGMQDDSLFAFAGIWDRWKDTSGNLVETCSILTTTPNSLLADIHNRMPVILQPQNYELWLDPGFKDLDTLTAMLKPFDPAQMKCYPVSTLVNSPANDNSACAAEVEPAQRPSLTLF